MNATLIVNPAAGRGLGLSVADAAERELEAGGWSVDREITDGPGHATDLAREAAAMRPDLVLACGGDGTLSQVLVGLLHTDVPAGLIPAGTGNDFARTLGLSGDPQLAAQQMLSGSLDAVDVLQVDEGSHHSLNVLGLGFDAGVVTRINRRRHWAGGKVAYLIAVAQQLIEHPSVEARVEVAGEVWEGRALLVVVANARSFGAGMIIAPSADIRDGLLDVVIVEAMSRLAFVRSFPLVMRGEHGRHPAVHMWQAPEVRIVTSEPTPVVIDGDIECQTPLSVRAVPGGAKLWLPSAEGDT